MPVAKVLVHEGYDHTQEGHDIALIKLSESIVNRICSLPELKEHKGPHVA